MRTQTASGLLLLGLCAAACADTQTPASSLPRDAGQDEDTTQTDTGVDSEEPVGEVLFTSPADGDIVSGVLNVEVELRWPVGLRGVELHVDGARLDTDLAIPFEFQLDTAELEDGPHTLKALAVSVDGDAIESEISLITDNSPPSVTLVSPVPDSTLFLEDQGVDIVFTLEDVAGVVDLSATVNGVEVALSDESPYTGRIEWETLGLTSDDMPFDIVVRIRATEALAHEQTDTFHVGLQTRLAWTFQTHGPIWGAPAFGPDGVIYIGARDNHLYAIEPNGTERWRVDTGAEIISDPAVDPQGNVVVTSGTSVQSYDPAATLRWNYNAGHAVNSSPAISPSGGLVYVGSYGAALLAIDNSNGRLSCSFATRAEVLSSPAVGADGWVYFGSHDSRVYGIAVGCVLVWDPPFETGDEVWSGPSITANGDVLVGSNDGYLYRLNRYGTLQWEFQSRGQIWGSAVEVADGTIYVGSNYRRLHALSAEGEELWQVVLAGLPPATPAVDPEGSIYVGVTDGQLYALKPDGNIKWRFQTEAEILASPSLSADSTMVFIGSTDRRLYALRTGVQPQAVCPPPETVVVGDAQVFRYEASRPDATETEQGTRTDQVCSRAGVQPWVRATWEEARAACATAGMDLCAGPTWEAACVGNGRTDFPYGQSYVAGTCHDECAGPDCVPQPSGSFPACASARGTMDMSGNVAEWVLEGNGEDDCCRYIRGGSFRDRGDDLRCSNIANESHLVDAVSRRDDVGFRCCTPAQ